jgi:hypothetical protein
MDVLVARLADPTEKCRFYSFIIGTFSLAVSREETPSLLIPLYIIMRSSIAPSNVAIYYREATLSLLMLVFGVTTLDDNIGNGHFIFILCSCIFSINGFFVYFYC